MKSLLSIGIGAFCTLGLGLSAVSATAQVAPVARDVRVVCDRWPDGSSLRRFSEDAIRLSGAKTEKEKALAVLQWMRRWTMFTDGTPPRERGVSVLDDLKILNVYGAHWCDGRALLMENMWRSIGGRAYKLYVPDGYTMALVNWKDDDGQERWHQVHASRGWYVYDRKGQWIATPDQIATDFSLMFRPSRTGIPRTGHPPRPWNWIAVGHRPFSNHDTTLNLNTGERYVRQWGNEGIPACNNVGETQYADGEHGPYAITYGNGRLVASLDLAGGGEIEAGGRTGFRWSLRTPHVLADAWVEGEFPDGLSVDYCPTETNRFSLPGPAGRRLELGRQCKADKNVVGRYSFPFHFSWPAGDPGRKEPPAKPLILTAVVQHNLFSLPQLQPGRNAITLSATLASNVALKVTYEWADADGRDKRNVTIMERSPHTYEIRVAGRVWADVRCRLLTIEVVSATGQGNRTEVREPPAGAAEPPPFPAMDAIVGDRKAEALKTVAEYVADLKIPEKRDNALHGLMVLRDKAALPALVEALESGEDMPVDQRGRICQAIHLSAPPKDAFDLLIPILKKDSRLKWIEKGDGEKTLASLVMHLAGESGYQAALPAMIERYRRGVGRFNKPACLRAFGKLKAREAVPFCREALREHSDISGSAAWALGEIGDASVIPDIIRTVESRMDKSRFQSIFYAEAATALAKLNARTPAALGLLEKMLLYPDEEVRGLAAEALGRVGGREQVEALRAAASRETFPWVKQRMESAAEGLAQRS